MAADYDIPAVYGRLIFACRALYTSAEPESVAEMAMRLMDIEGVPMHAPYHHFIVPAVLLTANLKAKDASRDEHQPGAEPPGLSPGHDLQPGAAGNPARSLEPWRRGCVDLQ